MIQSRLNWTLIGSGRRLMTKISGCHDFEGDSMKFVRTFGLALLFCSMAAMLGAQGVQTGTVRGVVQDEQGLAVPGVTVTVTSPALQGPALRTSDAYGRLRLPEPAPRPLHREIRAVRVRAPSRRTPIVPLGGIIQQNVTHAHGRPHRNGPGRGRIAGADCDAGRRHEHQARRDRGARHAAHAAGDRDAVARPHRAARPTAASS